MEASDQNILQHDAPECDAPSPKEQVNNASSYIAAENGRHNNDEQACKDIDRRISVERKKRQSGSGTLNTASQHSAQRNLLSNENEENEISETRVSGNVLGKRVILIDDVIDTGRQLKTAVQVR